MMSCVRPDCFKQLSDQAATEAGKHILHRKVPLQACCELLAGEDGHFCSAPEGLSKEPLSHSMQTAVNRKPILTLKLTFSEDLPSNSGNSWLRRCSHLLPSFTRLNAMPDCFEVFGNRPSQDNNWQAGVVLEPA